MTLCFWRPKPTPIQNDIESIRHEIRNALLGIQIERKRLTEALGASSKALMGLKCHMERIDSALKPKPLIVSKKES